LAKPKSNAMGDASQRVGLDPDERASHALRCAARRARPRRAATSGPLDVLFRQAASNSGSKVDVTTAVTALRKALVKHERDIEKLAGL
jgi:hypothetical protein